VNTVNLSAYLVFPTEVGIYSLCALIWETPSFEGVTVVFEGVTVVFEGVTLSRLPHGSGDLLTMCAGLGGPLLRGGDAIIRGGDLISSSPIWTPVSFQGCLYNKLKIAFAYTGSF
jgi:hypothetical protein